MLPEAYVSGTDAAFPVCSPHCRAQLAWGFVALETPSNHPKVLEDDSFPCGEASLSTSMNVGSSCPDSRTTNATAIWLYHVGGNSLCLREALKMKVSLNSISTFSKWLKVVSGVPSEFERQAVHSLATSSR